MVTRTELENALRENDWCMNSSTSSSFSYSKNDVSLACSWDTVCIGGERLSFTTDFGLIKIGKSTLSAKSTNGLTVKMNL